MGNNNNQASLFIFKKGFLREQKRITLFLTVLLNALLNLLHSIIYKIARKHHIINKIIDSCGVRFSDTSAGKKILER